MESPVRRGTIVRPVAPGVTLKNNPLGDPAERETPVYLPPSYDEHPGRRYPLIIVIAGFTGNGRMMLNEGFFDEPLDHRLDRLIGSGAMSEAIVMLPDCMTRYGGSQYLDSPGTGRYQTYLLDELVAWADANFRTIPEREARGIAGKSSGGFGSFRAALDRPDVVSAFACHSGDLAFEYCYHRDFGEALRYLWAKNLTPKQFLDSFAAQNDRGGGFFPTLDLCAMASCYSPNPGNEAGFDLPFDLRTGEIREDVWNRWLAHDPIRLIEAKADALRSQSLVFVDCGRRDEYFLDVGARRAAAMLEGLGIGVVHEEFDAGHMGIQYRYDRSLPLLAKSLAPPEG